MTVKIRNPETPDDGTFECFFEQTGAGQYVQRNLMVDLEPNVIDDVRKVNILPVSMPSFCRAEKRMQLITLLEVTTQWER